MLTAAHTTDTDEGEDGRILDDPKQILRSHVTERFAEHRGKKRFNGESKGHGARVCVRARVCAQAQATKRD